MWQNQNYIIYQILHPLIGWEKAGRFNLTTKQLSTKLDLISHQCAKPLSTCWPDWHANPSWRKDIRFHDQPLSIKSIKSSLFPPTPRWSPWKSCHNNPPDHPRYLGFCSLCDGSIRPTRLEPMITQTSHGDRIFVQRIILWVAVCFFCRESPNQLRQDSTSTRFTCFTHAYMLPETCLNLSQQTVDLHPKSWNRLSYLAGPQEFTNLRQGYFGGVAHIIYIYIYLYIHIHIHMYKSISHHLWWHRKCRWLELRLGAIPFFRMHCASTKTTKPLKGCSCQKAWKGNTDTAVVCLFWL